MADINYESPPLATEDKTVQDDQGRNRLVFAGQPIPPHLAEAYEAAGGSTEEGAPPPEAENIAEADLVVEDANGRRRKIVAGAKVPHNLVDAYEEAGGTITNKTVQAAPETDKMQRGPDTAAAEEGDEAKGDIGAARRRKR